MTESELWNHFAAHALGGLCSSMSKDTVNEISEGVIGGRHYIRAACSMATAMMLEVKRRENLISTSADKNADRSRQ